MPKTDESATVEARAAQRADSKNRTYDLLRGKRRAQRELVFEINDEDGEPQKVTLLFRAIGTSAYDRLITKYPPTTEQRADGANYNIDEFAPALLADVCVDPEMTKAQWSEIWDSDDWSRGETMDLFMAAVEVCSRGLKAVPTSAPD